MIEQHVAIYPIDENGRDGVKISNRTLQHEMSIMETINRKLHAPDSSIPLAEQGQP